MKQECEDSLKKAISILNRNLIDYYANVPASTAQEIILMNGKVYSASQLLQYFQRKMNETKEALEHLVGIVNEENK